MVVLEWEKEDTRTGIVGVLVVCDLSDSGGRKSDSEEVRQMCEEIVN